MINQQGARGRRLRSRVKARSAGGSGERFKQPRDVPVQLADFVGDGADYFGLVGREVGEGLDAFGMLDLENRY